MVRIIDSTLREGLQSGARPFTPEQSVEVARLLARCGVDTIECGHPAVGREEVERVAAVRDAIPDVPILAHARANRRDVDAVAATGVAWVGIFLGVNEISRQTRLVGRTDAELHGMIDTSVRQARDCGLRVRFTVEDATRTVMDELVAAYAVALAAGSDRICLADTLGIAEPGSVATCVAALRSAFSDVDLEVHLHDDRGLALANALAAIDAGASWVSVSVNGIGERAGIVDLAGLLANLHFRGTRPLVDGSALRELSRRVGAYSGSAPDARRPVVGRDAFRHVAKLHRDAVERDPRSYEWIDTGLFGSAEAAPRARPALSPQPEDWIVRPEVISATELRHHRAGPGRRYVAVDDRFVPGADQYCIVRRIEPMDDHGPGHVDVHSHDCDSLFVFLGDRAGYEGLEVEVTLGSSVFLVRSPAAVFIPAGVPHSYAVLGGAGTYINHVLRGDYNSSLLDPLGPAETAPVPHPLEAAS